MFTIEIQNRQSQWSLDVQAIRGIVESILTGEGVEAASIQVVIVDDVAIHDLNRRYLNHDEPTDVLSFPLEESPAMEGCVVASAETAARAARSFGWNMADELLLYVVHGTLHLVGYDDLTPELRAQMRAKERQYLSLAGLYPRYNDGGDDCSPFPSLGKGRNAGAAAGALSSDRSPHSEGARP